MPSPRTYLVTGCTGFIGLHLTRLLLAEGHRVIGLVRNPAKLPADLAGRVDVLAGDLSLFARPDVVLPRADVVVHLAAVVAGKNEAEYALVNRDAVADVLAALERQTWKPQRFLFASSLAAAGPNTKNEVHSEADEAAPINPYGVAKRDAELLVSASSFPTTSFRPPLVLGAGNPASLTLYKMAASGFAPLPAGPPQRLSFIDVSDLARAIVTMALDESRSHRVYFTTSEAVMTNRQLLEVVARAMGRKLTVVPVPRAVLKTAMYAATTAARVIPFKNQLDRKQYEQMVAPAFVCTSAQLTADTGWRAQMTLDESVVGAVQGYRALGWL